MTTLIATRPTPLVHWLHGSVQAGPWNKARQCHSGTAADKVAEEQAFLAIVVPAAANYGELAFAEWRAELKLAECGRKMPFAWPIKDWLGDYCDLLATVLPDKKVDARSAWWVETIAAFLELMLAGQDKSGAEFIRTLTRSRPLSDETRQIRRVQALFASIRPALSLTEALGFRIVVQSRASHDAPTP